MLAALGCRMLAALGCRIPVVVFTGIRHPASGIRFRGIRHPLSLAH